MVGGGDRSQEPRHGATVIVQVTDDGSQTRIVKAEVMSSHGGPDAGHVLKVGWTGVEKAAVPVVCEREKSAAGDWVSGEVLGKANGVIVHWRWKQGTDSGVRRK